MKIAFVYGPMSLGARHLDFARLYDDPRGLTGSELSCVEYARAMARRGHDVTLYVYQPMAENLWLSGRGETLRGMIGEIGDGILVCGQDKIGNIGLAGWDAICVWNEPDILRGAHPGAVRLVNQQLNDFTYCQRDPECFTEFVDVFTSPSQHHLDFIRPHAMMSRDGVYVGCTHWEVLPNGCDPTLYTDGLREPGRVLWASSPDRGLHLLLQAWPEIRRHVPHATLHALYNFAPGPLLEYEEGSIGLNGLPVTPDIQELANRYRYIRYAMERLKDHGVVAIGSCSRNRVAQEMNEAVVLAYPCDTIRYTEGFSVTTMEACAAGVVPVTSGEDALPSIYGGNAVFVPVPVADNMETFARLVVQGLTDDAFRTQISERCRALAERHTWRILAGRLDKILYAEVEKKRGVADAPEKVLPPLGTGSQFSTCKFCRKTCERWQIFCGAACCARWEGGERPSDEVVGSP